MEKIKNTTFSSNISATGTASFIRLNHLPELDSLRCIAVILVILAHYLPSLGWPGIPYAWYGVDIFFSISGFLITTILLIALNKQPSPRRLPIIKNFMIRRAFRLFPLYYAFIISFWLLKKFGGIHLWKDEFTPYFFTYTPNWLFYKTGLHTVNCFPHLWSLGVEEQFYLVWPWLLLFTPKRLLYYAILALIVIALGCSYFFYQDVNFHLLPFANFHTLGTGALLGVIYTNNNKLLQKLRQYRIILCIAASAQLLVALLIFRPTAFLSFYRDFSLCIFTTSLVLVSIFGWSGIAGYFSRWSVPQYIGKISYGIYLFHLTIPALLAIVLAKTNLNLPGYLLFLIYIVVTLCLAVLSYKFLEMPFLKLKKRFED